MTTPPCTSRPAGDFTGVTCPRGRPAGRASTQSCPRTVARLGDFEGVTCLGRPLCPTRRRPCHVSHRSVPRRPRRPGLLAVAAARRPRRPRPRSAQPRVVTMTSNRAVPAAPAKLTPPRRPDALSFLPAPSRRAALLRAGRAAKSPGHGLAAPRRVRRKSTPAVHRSRSRRLRAPPGPADGRPYSPAAPRGLADPYGSRRSGHCRLAYRAASSDVPVGNLAGPRHSGAVHSPVRSAGRLPYAGAAAAPATTARTAPRGPCGPRPTSRPGRRNTPTDRALSSRRLGRATRDPSGASRPLRPAGDFTGVTTGRRRPLHLQGAALGIRAPRDMPNRLRSASTSSPADPRCHDHSAAARTAETILERALGVT